MHFTQLADLSDYLNKPIMDAILHASNKANGFLLGISGGSVLDILDTSHWPTNARVISCLIDERYTLDPHDQNIHLLKKSAYQSRSDLQAGIVKIDYKAPITECAQKYEKQIWQHLKAHNNQFDMILLGAGEDGHIASLFPEHPLLTEKTPAICVINDSPKPPPSRITFNMPMLLKSKKILLVIKGSAKKEIAKRVLAHDTSIPAGRLAREHPDCEVLVQI